MARYPDLTVQPLSATVAKYLVPDIYVKQGNGPGRTNNATASNDSELAGIPLDVGTYKIEVVLHVTGAGGDIRVQWGFTGTWSGKRAVLGPGPGTELQSGTDAPMRTNSPDLGSPATYGLNSSILPVAIREISYNVVVTAAGDMSVQWAQETADAGSTTSVVAGSAVEVRRIA